MTIKNATEFCRLVESRLGWVPPPGLWHRRYQGPAKRVNQRMAELNADTDNPLYTWHNLELAVELCWRERLPRNPLGVLKLVERAVEMARVPEATLWAQVTAAVQQERALGDLDGWAVRLTRAQGEFQRDVLNEWRAARGAS